MTTMPFKKLNRLNSKVCIPLCASMLMLCVINNALAAEPKVTYVGDGRYTCSGNSPQCAQIDANNRQREAQRQADYQRDQDRAQNYVDNSRRREEERKREQSRY
jgi:hypothetical protein